MFRAESYFNNDTFGAWDGFNLDLVITGRCQTSAFMQLALQKIGLEAAQVSSFYFNFNIFKFILIKHA